LFVVRGLVVMLATLAACGRLGFEERTTTDGDSDSPNSGGDGPGAAMGWTRITAGDETTCGIYKSRAYCWGRGSNNEIGDGVATNRPSPTLVALPAGTVTDIVQGEGHGCAIVDDSVYCWGLAAIGNGNPQAATPQKITALPANVTSLSAGGQFVCAVAGGNVYCWGNESSGSLGNGAAGSSFTPALVTLPTTAISVDAGNDHAIALLSDGSLYVWGHNDNGCFGVGSTTPTSSDVPLQTAASASVLPRLAGWHMCALENGAVRCWGEGTSGELGNNMFNDSSNPVQVVGMTAGVTTMETGGGPSNHDASCAVIAGAVSCWGNGTFGRLGTGNANDAPTPQPVSGVPATVVELALGFEHACARGSDGSLRCWGRGDLGQLGNGMSANSLVPVVVPLPP
jgi:alpha-tubulin suppressor-like RCC1 family protein